MKTASLSKKYYLKKARWSAPQFGSFINEVEAKKLEVVDLRTDRQSELWRQLLYQKKYLKEAR